MQATVEISLYALTEDYEAEIIDFIKQLQQHPSLEVEVNGLSTQIFGDYETIMDTLKEKMGEVLEEQEAVFVMKVAAGELKRDKLPDSLQ